MSKENNTVFGGKDNPESMWGPDSKPDNWYNLLDSIGFEDVNEVTPEEIPSIIIASHKMNKSIIDSLNKELVRARGLLSDCAECMDDALIKIYPEEFTEKYKEDAGKRFANGGGIINRIATIADKARAESIKD